MFKPVHIIKLEMIRCEDLIPMRIISEDTCRFSRSLFFEEVPIEDVVGVSVSDEYDKNQKIYTTTATFKTRCKKLLRARRMAFRLTSADGKQYMIGTNARTYPIIKESNPFPEKVPDSSLKTVTITWKGLNPMLLILD